MLSSPYLLEVISCNKLQLLRLSNELACAFLPKAHQTEAASFWLADPPPPKLPFLWLCKEAQGVLGGGVLQVLPPGPGATEGIRLHL